MSFIKKLAGDTVLYGISSIVGRFLNWLLVIVHTRVFELPRVLSDNVELYAWVIPLNVIYTFGMETTFFRYGSKKENQQDYFNHILSFVLLLGLFLSCLIYFSATSIVNYLEYPGKAHLVKWLAIIMAVDAICAIAFVKLRAQNKARRFVRIKLINISINIGLNVFYFIFCQGILLGNFLPSLQPFAAYFYKPSIGPDYIIWANYVASTVTLVLLWKEFIGFRFKINWEKLQPVLQYAYPLLIMGLAGSINLTADRLMFRKLLPDGFYSGLSTEDAFSIYSNVYKLSIFMTLVVQAYRYAADPFFFSKMGDKNSPKMIAISTKWFTLACIVIWLAVSINLDWIGLLLGPSYRSGLVVVSTLLLANLFIGVYGNISIWFKLTDKTHYGTWITFGAMLITIALNMVLIPKLGYMGCAYSFAFSSFAMVAACYILGQKHFPVPYESLKIFLYLLAAGILILLNSYFKIEHLGFSIPVHLLQIFGFLAAIYFFERKGFDELKMAQ
ncbi:polysaccharide biosynthesis C-terminal domain-containing protein [Marinilongibacter aquaticus]|uniref:lipopolysaccharide biosynthesis protein n=1 Tax=Marinilongibacter aquaticus TaxID=2975157 RepID=UPI0021BD1BB5|nr:polysaccharide biosynthesis C-terminal domain-containing protein [Marinilongibacter aquaticus]UBM57748.1 polysaccharide biosynthesis C-terminal domain-containing protein [Marinilongibacter aquaticus]